MSVAGWKPKHGPWVIALTVTLATFMEVLDTSIANVSLPHIAGNLSVGVDESTWVLTSYLVANAIILPISAWISSLIGRKNYYMLSVVIFTVSSIFSGLAPTLGWLVVARVLQGLGGGGLQPSEQAILADTFPQEKLGMGMAIYGVAVVTAPIIGPTLGGWITDNFSWRWIFFINVPVGLLSLFLTSRMVEDPPTFERRSLDALHIDYIGLSAIALGLGCFQILMDKGQREDWFQSHLIVMLAVISGCALLFSLFWELTRKDPMVEVRLLKERNFFLANVMMFMLGFVLFGSTAMLPIFLQTLMGYTATTAGLVLSPGGLVTMICMPIVGFLLGRYQARWLIAWGLGVVSISLFRMSHFNLGIDYQTALVARLVQAAGLAFLFIPINTAAYAYVSHNKHTQASGLINLARNLGGGVGIAVATTLLSRYAQVFQNNLSAHVTATSPAYISAITRLSRQLFFRGMPIGQTHGMAQGLYYGELVRQSNMLAYAADFRFMGYACLATLILVFFLKKGTAKKGEIAVH